MTSIIITGSTRGIGRGLAEAFLQRGCQVLVSGRDAQLVDQAVRELAQEFNSAGRVVGRAADVTQAEQLEGLWSTAQAAFGRVDIWINNAGISHPSAPLWELPAETLRQVIETNLIGAMLGSRTAIRAMLVQGGGYVYTMEGLGSDGRKVPGLSIYGASKRGLHYLTETLVAETRSGPVRVGSLSPGMVLTDLLISPEVRRRSDWESTKRIYNILADRVETVAPWLADQILANRRHGARIAWLTTPKIIGRFLTARIRPRRVFDEGVG